MIIALTATGAALADRTSDASAPVTVRYRPVVNR